MRVLFLTHYYPPEVGAPQTRIAALASGLQLRGVQVTVHTGFPNYPDGRIQHPYKNRPVQVQTQPDGVRVVRSAVIPAANKGFALRLANHLGFCASSVAAAGASGKQDVVVVESPPLFTAGAGVLYANAKRAPLILNASDLWPASAVQLGALRNQRMIAAAEKLEAWVYRSAAAITVPTEGMLRALRANPVTARKVERMPPFVDLRRFTAEPASGNGPLRVLYAGTVGMAQGIATLIDGAAMAGPSVVEVAIAGWGAEGDLAQSRILESGVENVKMLGIVPPDAVPSLYRESDLGVVLLRDRPIFAEALPTKLFECMAAGRPLIVSARGESCELVQRAGAGVAVTPESAGALAETFIDLHARRNELPELGRRGRDFVERVSPLETALDHWQDVLDRVAGHGGRASRRRSAAGKDSGQPCLNAS